MYYRIGDKVKIRPRNLGKPDIWGGMCGKISHIVTPSNYAFGFYGYGIELDEVDAHGGTKVIFRTRDLFKEHCRLTKTDSSKLRPKFLHYRKFKFSNGSIRGKYD